MPKKHPNFYQMGRSIRDRVIPNTSGYHIHFQFKESEVARATLLKETVKKFIHAYNKALPKNFPKIYLTEEYQSTEPVGPWNERMWELEISPFASKDKVSLDAFDREKNEAAHSSMKEIVTFIRQLLREDQELGLLGIDGMLLIHANIYPDNSDMRREQRLHRLDQAWLAYGNPEDFALKDIWVELIEIEDFLKEHIKKLGSEWENSKEQQDSVVAKLIEKFGNEPRHLGEKRVEGRARSLLKGQALLHELEMQQQESELALSKKF